MQTRDKTQNIDMILKQSFGVNKINADFRFIGREEANCAVALLRRYYENKSNSAAGAVQVAANMHEQLGDHLQFRKQKCY